jgi:hypothetical protein
MGAARPTCVALRAASLPAGTWAPWVLHLRLPAAALTHPQLHLLIRFGVVCFPACRYLDSMGAALEAASRGADARAAALAQAEAYCGALEGLRPRLLIFLCFVCPTCVGLHAASLPAGT